MGGAGGGRGLGHPFPVPTGRARVLGVPLDPAPVDGRPPADQLRVLLDELGRYEPDLLERPRLVVGTKADVAAADFVPAGGTLATWGLPWHHSDGDDG